MGNKLHLLRVSRKGDAQENYISTSSGSTKQFAWRRFQIIIHHKYFVDQEVEMHTYDLINVTIDQESNHAARQGCYLSSLAAKSITLSLNNSLTFTVENLEG